jgi:hypothetical protein
VHRVLEQQREVAGRLRDGAAHHQRLRDEPHLVEPAHEVRPGAASVSLARSSSVKPRNSPGIDRAHVDLVGLRHQARHAALDQEPVHGAALELVLRIEIAFSLAPLLVGLELAVLHQAFSLLNQLRPVLAERRDGNRRRRQHVQRGRVRMEMPGTELHREQRDERGRAGEGDPTPSQQRGEPRAQRLRDALHCDAGADAPRIDFHRADVPCADLKDVPRRRQNRARRDQRETIHVGSATEGGPHALANRTQYARDEHRDNQERQEERESHGLFPR